MQRSSSRRQLIGTLDPLDSLWTLLAGRAMVQVQRHQPARRVQSPGQSVTTDEELASFADQDRDEGDDETHAREDYSDHLLPEVDIPPRTHPQWERRAIAMRYRPTHAPHVPHGGRGGLKE